MNLPLDQIRKDGGTQARAQLDWGAIDEYAASMKEGEEFPPIIVYYDGTDYWLADGFHRVSAAEKAGLTEIAADVRQGTRRDAILHSVGANANHGVRRTNRDKRQAVMMILRDEEWGKLFDGDIARLCGVTSRTVATIRNEMINENFIKPSPERFGLRNGKVQVRNVANLGRKPSPLLVPEALPPTLWPVPMLTDLVAPEVSQPTLHDTEFTYRIAPDDLCLIERCPNQDVECAHWYWYMRRDTAEEAAEAFLRLGKSMGLPIQDDVVPTTGDELVYEDYDMVVYDIGAYDTDDYDVDEDN
jgi:hypothetical protein